MDKNRIILLMKKKELNKLKVELEAKKKIQAGIDNLKLQKNVMEKNKTEQQKKIDAIQKKIDAIQKQIEAEVNEKSETYKLVSLIQQKENNINKLEKLEKIKEEEIKGKVKVYCPNSNFKNNDKFNTIYVFFLGKDILFIKSGIKFYTGKYNKNNKQFILSNGRIISCTKGNVNFRKVDKSNFKLLINNLKNYKLERLFIDTGDNAIKSIKKIGCNLKPEDRVKIDINKIISDKITPEDVIYGKIIGVVIGKEDFIVIEYAGSKKKYKLPETYVKYLEKDEDETPDKTPDKTKDEGETPNITPQKKIKKNKNFLIRIIENFFKEWF